MLGGLHFLLLALGLVLPPLQQDAVVDVPAEIAELAAKRWQAKQAKDWTTADVLRKELEAACS